MAAPSYPVVMMSCKDGTGLPNFLTEIEQLSGNLMGKHLIALKYPYSMHNKVTKWLFEHANISSVENMEYEGDSITLRVPIDDVVH